METVLATMREYKTFVLNKERWKMPGQEPLEMEVYRTHNGHLITARHGGKRPGLIKTIDRLEITPEKASPKHGTCSIGKSAKDGKWYGWSHRAMVGFGKGDRIFQERYTGGGKLCEACKAMEDCEGLPCPSSIPFRLHGEKTITNDAEARQAAIAFARSVS